jgi:small-conductance mechanosensitive channel
MAGIAGIADALAGRGATARAISGGWLVALQILILWTVVLDMAPQGVRPLES